MNDKANNFNTVPFSGERLQQHRVWMQVMSEGELTPASSVNRRIGLPIHSCITVNPEDTPPSKRV